MKHYFNEGEEYLREDNIDLRGRTQKQYEDSAKIVVWAAAIAGVFVTIAVIQHFIFAIF